MRGMRTLVVVLCCVVLCCFVFVLCLFVLFCFVFVLCLFWLILVHRLAIFFNSKLEFLIVFLCPHKKIFHTKQIADHQIDSWLSLLCCN